LAWSIQEIQVWSLEVFGITGGQALREHSFILDYIATNFKKRNEGGNR